MSWAVHLQSGVLIGRPSGTEFCQVIGLKLAASGADTL